MLGGPLYSGPFESCSVVGRGGLDSCLVMIVYSLDVENVGIYVVSNTIDIQFTVSLYHVLDHKIFVTVYNILELHTKENTLAFIFHQSLGFLYLRITLVADARIRASICFIMRFFYMNKNSPYH